MRFILFLKFMAFIIVVVLPIAFFFIKRKNKQAQEAANSYQVDYDKGNYENCLRLLRKQFYSWSSDSEEKQSNLDVLSKMTDCLDKLHVSHKELTDPAIQFLTKYLHVDSEHLDEKEKESYTEMDDNSIKPIVRFLTSMEKGNSVEESMKNAYKKGMLD